MNQQNFPYAAGDWIAVPLKDGWAIGLIARVNQYGACLGYFFSPLLKERPNVEQLKSFRPEQAVLVRRFHSLELEEGKWPILGRLSDWDYRQWPVPKFRFRHDIARKWIIRQYDDCLNFGPERWGATDEEVRDLPDDGTSYGGALKLHLADLLGTKAGITEPTPEMLAAMNEPPQHFLYFHDKELADHAAEICRQLGYDPVFEKSTDPQHSWLLLARHKKRAATEDEMERAGQQLAKVAEEWGGVYDGWDRPT